MCGETLVAQEEIPALGHTEVTDEAVEASCGSSGKTEGSHCSECGEIIVAQEIVPATGRHAYESVTPVPADHSVAGYFQATAQIQTIAVLFSVLLFGGI